MTKKIAIVIAVALLLLYFSAGDQQPAKQKLENVYPWQITLTANGSSSVFNIQLGATTLAQASAVLKSRPEIGLFENKKGFSLEAYYKSITLGGLGGDFILTLELSEAELKNIYQKIKASGLQPKPMKSGSYRYDLDSVSFATTDKMIIRSLNYIPHANLDEDIIINKFGEPSRLLVTKRNEDEEIVEQHYFYADKGLDIILSKEGKEVLQYVAPKDFNLLAAPLLEK